MTEENKQKTEGIKEVANLIYLGKKFHSDKGDYKLYKTMWKKDMTDQFEINIWTRGNIGIKKTDGSQYCKMLDELKESETYNVTMTINIKPNQAGVMSKFRSMNFIHDEKEITNTPATTTPKKPEVAKKFPTTKAVSDSEIAWCKSYVSSMKKQGKEVNSNHFLGAYCRIGFKKDVGTEFVDRIESLYNKHVNVEQIDMT